MFICRAQKLIQKRAPLIRMSDIYRPYTKESHVDQNDILCDKLQYMECTLGNGMPFRTCISRERELVRSIYRFRKLCDGTIEDDEDDEYMYLYGSRGGHGGRGRGGSIRVSYDREMKQRYEDSFERLAVPDQLDDIKAMYEAQLQQRPERSDNIDEAFKELCNDWLDWEHALVREHEAKQELIDSIKARWARKDAADEAIQ